MSNPACRVGFTVRHVAAKIRDGRGRVAAALAARSMTGPAEPTCCPPGVVEFRPAQGAITSARAAGRAASRKEPSRDPPTKGRGESLTSEIYRNEAVFDSFAPGNIKDLDYRPYLKLELATGKRMSRFLDKRPYRKPEMTFDPEDFAFAHIGPSRGDAEDVGKVEEKLRPAIRELIEAGFLDPTGDEGRSIKDGGEWKVPFRRMEPEMPGPDGAQPEDPIARELIGRGVTPITARGLAGGSPAEAIALKLEIFDWPMAKEDERISEDPAGYLAKSTRDDHATPSGFESEATLETRRPAKEQAGREDAAREADSRKAEAKIRAENEAIDAHLAGLTSERYVDPEREAIANAPDGLNPRFFAKQVVRDRVGKRLGLGEGWARNPTATRHVLGRS